MTDRSRLPGGGPRLLLFFSPIRWLLGGVDRKSGSSNSGRTRPRFLEGDALGHSMASSLDFAWISQKPMISSFVSAKGPSMT